MLAQEHLDIISYLKNVGYGYQKFATSVERQGFCSRRQYTTMLKMKRDIENRQREYDARCKRYDKSYSNYRNNYRSNRHSPDWFVGEGDSDSEAMSMGEYF